MRILIIEDHKIFTEGLIKVLKTTFSEANIQTTYSYDETLVALHKYRFDLIFLDLNLKGVNMMKEITVLKSINPQAKMIILSSYFSPRLVQEAKALGVNGYLMKNSTEDEIISAVKTFDTKEEFVVSGYSQASTLPEHDMFSHIDSLSTREKEIMILIAKGNTNSKIAKELFISTNTVHTHRKNIYKKLKITSVQELIYIAYKYHLIK